MSGSLLICGTHSDAGKSLVTAGICRWLADRGTAVAPFKAQNMALNSVVVRGGFEIGRAQAMQAAAARVSAQVEMNPILIKPSGERHSQLVVMGRPHAEISAGNYQGLKDQLRPIVADALSTLREQFDAVICEGAGSPAEINLRAADLTNMGLARAANLPVLLVGDIDRGGVFASLMGTLAALDEDDQRHVAGFVINKFRGDPAILASGLDELQERTGRPVLGVLPWLEDLTIDAEDSLGVSAPRADVPGQAGTLDVAVVRLRWMSNFTDLDALAQEPGVRVRFTRSPVDLERADLVVIPGTKATVADLARLRADGLDAVLAERVRRGSPTLGICGGYQLLGTSITDDVESGAGTVAGLGLLPVTTRFGAQKVLRDASGHSTVFGGAAHGYEIRHGEPVRHGAAALITTAAGDEGCIDGAVAGTSWHGVLEHDDARRGLLRWVADRRGLAFRPAPDTDFAALRERQLTRLGALVEEHLDTATLLALLRDGVPPSLPHLALRLEGSRC